jgi:hypothetical protein
VANTLSRALWSPAFFLARPAKAALVSKHQGMIRKVDAGSSEKIMLNNKIERDGD